MDTWLSLLPLELEGITEYIEPDVEITPNDIFVGEMSDTSRKLFTYSRKLAYDANTKRSAIMLSNDQNYKVELEAKAAELATKCDTARDLMWIGIKDEFLMWEHQSIGVRRGYKVVISPVPTLPQILGIGGIEL